jgi:PAS domain S-box-containing protein
LSEQELSAGVSTAALRALRLLLVEDSEDDAVLIEHQIRRGGFALELTRVTTAAAMREKLRNQEWDLVISDYRLPGSSGDEALALLRADGRDIPFLLVSGIVGEEAAVEAMRLGANDYVLKDRLARLVPAIQRELAEADHRRAARAADAELKLAQSRLLAEVSGRARDLEALHRVAVGLAGMLDIGEVAKLTVEQAAKMVGADGAILRWLDVERGVLTVLAATGLKGWRLSEEVPLDDLGDVRSHPTIYNDYARFARAQPAALKAGVRSLAMVPLNLGDRVAGSLVVFSRSAAAFSQANVEMLGLLAAQVAPAIELKHSIQSLQASEARFKTAFEFSPTGLSISSAEGHYLAVSPALCRMLGYSESELLRMEYFEITHPDDRPAGRERSRQLRAGELDGYHVNKRYLRRDGRTVWAELSVSAVRDEAGAVVQLITQTQDITERKVAQDALAKSLAFLEAAQEIGKIGTFIAWLTPDKVGVDEWSKTCMEIFGYDETTYDGTNEGFWRRVHPDDCELVRKAQEDCHSGEKPNYDVRHRIIRPDGEMRWIRELAVTERDADGMPVRFVGVTLDITEETLAAETLRASEARNAAVIESAVDCIIVTDADGLATTFNPAAERVFGYKKAEVLGRDPVLMIVPERFQAEHREGHRLLESGDTSFLDQRFEIILRRADGTEMPAEISTSRFEVDGATLYSSSIRDLSDRDLLLASRESLAEVVANTQVMLFAYDSKGVITLAEGRATKSLLGVEPGAAIGLNAFELMKDVPEAIEHLKRGLAGETFAGVIELSALGIWVESRYTPTLDPDGKVIGMTGVATDISDRVRGAQAREESDAKTRLVAVVNHELRTPLNSILGFTELLLNERVGTLNDKQHRYASNVESAGRHLLALINDSLDLSRIAAGKMDLEIFELELAPLLDQAAGQIQPLVDSRGLEIRVDAGGQPWVRADRRRLLQVLWNLLSNAIRHTPTGGILTISARSTETTVEVSVSDTGIGIPAEQLERIFEEYAQVEGQADGTGLGLPVSRRLAKLMDGDIKVVSEVGVGSTFTITLPRGHTSTR